VGDADPDQAVAGAARRRRGAASFAVAALPAAGLAGAVFVPDELKRRLGDRIDDVIAQLYPNARRAGNFWYMGSVQGEPGGSLGVWRRGAKRGEWCDFTSRQGGSALGLVIEAMGGDKRRGIEWAAAFTGAASVNTETPQERAAREDKARRRREALDREEARARERKSRAAQGHFVSAQPIAGTPVEAYLAGRAIDLRRLGRQPGALRFKPMQCPESGLERPCMLAAVTGPDGGFLTVHRTFLHVLPDGRVVKASAAAVPGELRMEDAKQCFSTYAGGHVPVWRGESGRHASAMPQGEWIVATEGVEDALSIALAAPQRRVWAAVTLNKLSKMALPAQCGGLYWHRHRGDGPEAVRAYEREREKLEARGVELRELWAPDEFKDFNEWAMAKLRAPA
jgi:hypothetical protein